MNWRKSHPASGIDRGFHQEEYERCVLCGAMTRVAKSTPIDRRIDYLYGAGQLCRECAIRNVNEEQIAMRKGFVYTIPIYQKDES